MVALAFAIGEQAARLRSQYSLRIPDAIQIAAALPCKATALLTAVKLRFWRIKIWEHQYYTVKGAI